MIFEDFIKSDLCKIGNDVYICDYRYDDFSKKPRRHIKPTKVKIFDVSDAKKKIYYSSIFFKTENGREIGPYDNTGYRSYAGVAVNVFASKEEANEYYMVKCRQIITAFTNYKELCMKKCDSQIEEIKKEYSTLT